MEIHRNFTADQGIYKFMGNPILPNSPGADAVMPMGYALHPTEEFQALEVSLK